MERRISIKGGITFCAYGVESMNTALLEIDGKNKYFTADTKELLMKKIVEHLIKE